MSYYAPDDQNDDDNESFEDMLEKEIASEINILPEKSPKTSAEDLFND